MKHIMDRRKFIKSMIPFVAFPSILVHQNRQENKEALEYSTMGRKLIVIDGIPEGALARYERDVLCFKHYMYKKGLTNGKGCSLSL